MELTREQISEFILKATSSSDGFNQLIEIMLNSLMQHERRMFLDETANSCNGFRPRRFCYGHYEFTSVRNKVLSIKVWEKQTFIDKIFDWGRIET